MTKSPEPKPGAHLLDAMIRDYFEDLEVPVAELLLRHGVSNTKFHSELAVRGIKPFGHSRRYMTKRGRRRPPSLSPAEEARLRARYCLAED
jgi:hypothetical protein